MSLVKDGILCFRPFYVCECVVQIQKNSTETWMKCCFPAGFLWYDVFKEFKQLGGKKQKKHTQTAWKDKAKLIKMLLVSQDKYLNFTEQCNCHAYITHGTQVLFLTWNIFLFSLLTSGTAYE